MASHEKALWLLECSEGKMGRLFTFYARDEKEAEDQAAHILTVFPHLIREKLHPQPYGFMLIYERLPGYIQDETSMQQR
jgi:hypothetical protein